MSINSPIPALTETIERVQSELNCMKEVVKQSNDFFIQQKYTETNNTNYIKLLNDQLIGERINSEAYLQRNMQKVNTEKEELKTKIKELILENEILKKVNEVLTSEHIWNAKMEENSISKTNCHEKEIITTSFEENIKVLENKIHQMEKEHKEEIQKLTYNWDKTFEESIQTSRERETESIEIAIRNHTRATNKELEEKQKTIEILQMNLRTRDQTIHQMSLDQKNQVEEIERWKNLYDEKVVRVKQLEDDVSFLNNK